MKQGMFPKYTLNGLFTVCKRLHAHLRYLWELVYSLWLTG